MDLGNGWPVAIFFGFLVSLSSTAIAFKLLDDSGEMEAPHGRTAASILPLQDLALVPMMLLVPVLTGPGDGIVVSAGIAPREPGQGGYLAPEETTGAGRPAPRTSDNLRICQPGRLWELCPVNQAVCGSYALGKSMNLKIRPPHADSGRMATAARRRTRHRTPTA